MSDKQKTNGNKAYLHLNAAENLLIDKDIRVSLYKRASEYCLKEAQELENESDTDE